LQFDYSADILIVIDTVIDNITDHCYMFIRVVKLPFGKPGQTDRFDLIGGETDGRVVIESPSKSPPVLLKNHGAFAIGRCAIPVAIANAAPL
jgi:hypothetical protein